MQFDMLYTCASHINNPTMVVGKLMGFVIIVRKYFSFINLHIFYTTQIRMLRK